MWEAFFLTEFNIYLFYTCLWVNFVLSNSIKQTLKNQSNANDRKIKEKLINGNKR